MNHEKYELLLNILYENCSFYFMSQFSFAGSICNFKSSIILQILIKFKKPITNHVEIIDLFLNNGITSKLEKLKLLLDYGLAENLNEETIIKIYNHKNTNISNLFYKYYNKDQKKFIRMRIFKKVMSDFILSVKNKYFI